MTYKIFDNLKQLEKSYPKLSTELLQNFDMGDWVNDHLFIYNSIEDFAKYELAKVGMLINLMILTTTVHQIHLIILI